MSSPSEGSVVSFTVKINGTAIPGNYPVSAIRVEQMINRIATATITLLDGSAADEGFPVSASASFVPGNDVSIEVGYDGLNTVVFQGIVTQQALRIDSMNGSLLEVECKDKAVKMTVGRKSANFSASTDSDVISKVIAGAGLTAAVSATRLTLPNLVQYYATDWDFILSRAEVNGLMISTLNNQVRVFDPVADTTSVRTLTYGNDIMDFNAQLNAIDQVAEVKASAWSFQSQQMISATAQNIMPGPGNLSSKTLASVVGLSSYDLQTSATETDAELLCWAQAQMLKSALSKITGEVRFQGSAAIVPGNYLSLKGLGARFDGDHFVSGITHDIADGNWFTEARIGMSPLWFAQEHEVQAPCAAGLLPGIQGLFNGTVLQLFNDPDGEFRIQVEVALFDDQATGVWARVANFYSTNGQGTFFLPEVGDEVILGFLNQDPRFPVILGSMYSQKNAPFSEFSPNEENSLKGIVSKSALRVLFDDKNAILSLITPGQNSVVLDDQHQKIEISDKNGNSIVMSESGITLKSDQNISMQAAQKITLTGDLGIEIQSKTGDVQTTAINIGHSANMQFSAKGEATAQVQGGMELTLKAALVMIN
ncbi:type IV secretion protein Rhs [Pseudomonas syringae]|uniref:Type IV secretion protein Rhs n=1 Tax=Pseudomonas syringae TaxID=317 RepID=A0A244EQM1_PSESX|nr:type VI secretion system tip protein VgrG [Pseudomonas syringae]OUM06833.1 type IV secretion protein Rhs [Pseudomonas syringae]